MASIKCPRCWSKDVQILGQKRKGFSVGKAAVGGVLTGGIGLLAGFAGANVKYDVFCGKCGHRWKVK